MDYCDYHIPVTIQNFLRNDLLIIRPDGSVENRNFSLSLWNGLGCNVRYNGYVVQQLRKFAQEFDCHFLCKRGDGPNFLSIHQLVELHNMYPRFLMPVASGLGAHIPLRCFQIPQDDDTTQYGIECFLFSCGNWHARYADKSDTVFWRGRASGTGLRRCLIDATIDKKGYDISLTSTYKHLLLDKRRPFIGLPERVLARPHITINEQLMYKYLVVVDGNNVPSNCDWVFASGCTPILLSEYHFLLMDYAKPWVHYVPVSLDCSDLDVNIQRARQCGEEIAHNAKELALRILTPASLQKIMRSNIATALSHNW